MFIAFVGSLVGHAVPNTEGGAQQVLLQAQDVIPVVRAFERKYLQTIALSNDNKGITTTLCNGQSMLYIA